MTVFAILIHLWGYKLSAIGNEIFWFNNIIMTLSAIALIYQYKNETTNGSNAAIDKNVVKDRISFIVFRGIFMGIAAFCTFELGYSRGIEFAQVSAFTVLNLNAVLFNYSFSNKLFFENKISNMITLLNLIIQFAFLILIYGTRFVINVKFWEIIGAFVGICSIIAITSKFVKEDYYD
jgi:hypothetical protein